jgi:hypothetical protein
MTQAQVQKQSKIKEQKREIKNASRIRFSLDIFNKAVFCLVIGCGLAYVLCMNDLSIKGFRLNELKKQTARLEMENTGREIEIMTLKSYANISQRANKFGLVPVGNPAYIEGKTAVVVRR